MSNPNFSKMTVAAVHDWLTDQGGSISASDLASLRQDSRKGVRQLAMRYQLNKTRTQMEQQRLARMWRREEQAWASGYKVIVGIDEAGCGPLAGPVVAAAVVFDRPITIKGLNDSKQLTQARRQELFITIQEQAQAIGIGVIHNEQIDRLNILGAAKAAMQQATQELNPVLPDMALVDGNQARLPQLSCPCHPITAGDANSASIAAASIIAKVTRDRLMDEFDAIYPGYGFAQHKGYPSRDHYAALDRLGPSPIHRKTFLRKYYEARRNEH